MAYGISLAMRYMTFKKPAPREQRERDRSLRGKARVKARKAARRTS